jgi:hypothetical protein
MPRKRKQPPDSTAWSSDTPDQGNYWLHGGPWIPPGEIPAFDKYPPRPENLRPGEKPATRIKSIAEMLDKARRDLAGDIADYVAIHERGAEALPQQWMKDRHSKGYAPGEPTQVHYQLANCYRSIALHKVAIPVYEALLDALETAQTPLFASKRKPS